MTHGLLDHQKYLPKEIFAQACLSWGDHLRRAVGIISALTIPGSGSLFTTEI